MQKDVKISIKEKQEKLEQVREKLKGTALSFFRRNTLHIEVNRSDNKLEKVKIYFLLVLKK